MQRCVAAAMDRILPRSLAAGSCFRRRAFCAAAVAAVSSRGQPPIADAALLPHTVRGIISNYFDHYRPEWFVRPRGNGSPTISMPYATGGNNDAAVRDHCNGLILYERDLWGFNQSLWVLNPATRRLAVLPPPREGDDFWRGTAGAYLAFNPSVSLHYDVFLIPEVPEPESHRHEDEAAERLHDDATRDGSAEWPPAVHRMQVYSSRSGVWVERAFVRDGGAPVGTVAEARADPVEPFKYYGPTRRYAVCWRGALYVHCRGDYVMRLSLLEDKYQIIKTPTNIVDNKEMHTRHYPKHYLGRSVKGVSYVELKQNEVRVWTIDESRGQMEWELKHHLYLGALGHQMDPMQSLGYKNKEQIKQPWAMLYHIIDSDKYDLEVQDASEWNSDEDDILEITNSKSKQFIGGFEFLGFHPYKEVMFFNRNFNVVTCHLSSSKAQYLGNAYPYAYDWSPWAGFEESFIYTPCLVDSLPKDDLSMFQPMDKAETPTTGPSI